MKLKFRFLKSACKHRSYVFWLIKCFQPHPALLPKKQAAGCVTGPWHHWLNHKLLCKSAMVNQGGWLYLWGGNEEHQSRGLMDFRGHSSSSHLQKSSNSYSIIDNDRSTENWELQHGVSTTIWSWLSPSIHMYSKSIAVHQCCSFQHEQIPIESISGGEHRAVHSLAAGNKITR